jgi:transposase-like protein
MGTITTELLPEDHTRDGRGHRITTPERRAELLQAYAASGLSRAAFARREGIKYPTFATWVQHREATPTAKPKATTGPVRFTELRLAARSNLEVVLPGGLLVRGTDAAAVAALARALVAGS